MPVVFRSRVFSVETLDVTTRGHVHEVAIVRHRPCVVLLPFDDDGRVVLVRQFRPALGRHLWELPAGGIDPDEDPDVAAARECEEEIGRVPHRLDRLAALYPTPGYCDELMVFYRASDLRVPAADSPHRPDDDEDITTQAFTIEEARAMVARGEIVDLKSAYGLTLASR